MVNMVAGGIYIFLLVIIVAVWTAARTNQKLGKKDPVFLLICICVICWLIADFAILYVNNISINIFI